MENPKRIIDDVSFMQRADGSSEARSTRPRVLPGGEDEARKAIEDGMRAMLAGASDMNITPETMVQRWTDPDARPLFKGNLIGENGCCDAQGDVLRCSGVSDEELRSLSMEQADRKVARLLGISVAESVLLRLVNDSNDGCPEDVFRDRAMVLGPNHDLWTAFARHIDTLTADDWSRIAASRAASGAGAWDEAGAGAWDEARTAAGTAAGDEARIAAWAAARAAARAAAGSAAGGAAGDAAAECIGWSHLGKPFFLRFFFDDPAAWVAKVRGGPTGRIVEDMGDNFSTGVNLGELIRAARPLHPNEGATEIERLRAALIEVRSVLQSWNINGPHERIIDEALRIRSKETSK